MWKRRFAPASPVPAYSRPYHVERWLSPTLVRAVHLTLPAPLPLAPLRQASVFTPLLAVWRPWVETALPFDVRCSHHLSLGRLSVAQLHLFFRPRQTCQTRSCPLVVVVRLPVLLRWQLLQLRRLSRRRLPSRQRLGRGSACCCRVPCVGMMMWRGVVITVCGVAIDVAASFAGTPSTSSLSPALRVGMTAA